MRLPWLGPAIVATGVLGAIVMGVYVIHARPAAGAVIDTIPLDRGETVVIRDEAGGVRSFIELHDGDTVKWQALIPHYAGAHGRPAIAWSPTSITVRGERSGQAEVFALARNTSVKLGDYRLSPEHEPNHAPATGPLTLTDHVRAYELTGGEGWHQLTAIDLREGTPLWRNDLGPAPITDGGTGSGTVWVVQDGARRTFDSASGHEAVTKAL